MSLIPRDPGVYIYYDKWKKIIYIGKAKNLRNRVSSYFVNTFKGIKTEKLVSDIAYVDFIKVRNELEAFFLESDLIKKHQPKYNIVQKDDKNYTYIVIEDSIENIDNNMVNVPRLYGTKNLNIKSAEYFGPYLNSREVNNALRVIRRVFPFRNCSKSKFSSFRRLKRPCLYGEIGICPAPCINIEGIKQNKQSILSIKQIMKRGYSNYVLQLNKKMVALSKIAKYEEAIKFRNIIRKFDTIFTDSILPNEYEFNPNLIEDINKNRVEQICEIFGIINALSHFRIECYDISNIMGQWSTGSMVVSRDGHLEQSEYRKFRIKYTKGITDFGMIREVVRRRAQKSWDIPDIMLIDGGKGQVSAVLKELNNMTSSFKDKFKDVKVVGICKPYDVLIQYKDNRWVVIKPLKTNEGYKHLILLRDEAHRFAKSYHKDLRRIIY